MALAAGSKLGPYEILAPLGAGGMGEVYRARDPRLGRDVAIKVLPERVSSDPEALARFEREAQAIAALSHPNILAIHDFGRQGDVAYAVTELLEGPTLSVRLARGPLPRDDLARIGGEICAALAAAHRKGIIHRDLKPANVMLTKAGVKLLDFGLAKTLARPHLDGLTTTKTETELTEAGTIMGTLDYMSPEQLEGKTIDARSDIFSLGGTLYEMATGRRAFSGSSPASLISSILKDDPTPITTLQPLSPPALERVVRMCLAKDPDKRWQSAQDVGAELAWALGPDAPGKQGAPRHRRLEKIAWGLALVAAFVAGAALSGILRKAPVEAAPIRFLIPPPKGTTFSLSVEQHDLALSPDGRRIAIVLTSAGMPRPQLWIRSLAETAPTPLDGTDGAASPFWSPDGRFLAFFADGKLKKIAAAGGLPQTICSVAGSNDGSWGSDGTILFSQIFADNEGIYQVSASGGGAPTLVILPDTDRKRWPQFLPDGRHFLYLARDPSTQRYVLRAATLGGREITTIAPPVESRVEYAPPGHLVFLREGALVARRFDPAKLQFSGEPISLADHILEFRHSGWAPFSVSPAGVIAFRAGTADSQLAWVDRTGRSLGPVGPPGEYRTLRLSPDGRKLAVEKYGPTGDSDIWILDIARNVLTPLTHDEGLESKPTWSPDGREIVFSSHGTGSRNGVTRISVASGEEKVLLPIFGNFEWTEDWSPDGRTLTFDHVESSRITFWLLPLEGERKPVAFRQGPYHSGGAVFSRDGRWIAYVSTESGRPEVFITPARAPGEHWQVSTSGAAREPPRWRADGKELFYVSAEDQLMAVPLKVVGESLDPGAPVRLFRIESNAEQMYDAAPDGQRFLLNPGTARGSVPVTVVVNWKPEAK